MSDFWQKLSSGLREESLNPQRMLWAHTGAISELRDAYSALISQCSQPEEIMQVAKLAEEEISSVCQKYASECGVDAVALEKGIWASLFPGQSQMEKVSGFSVTKDGETFTVSLEKSTKLGPKEYDGSEAVYFVTIMQGDKYVASIPFLSLDGSVPPEAELLYEQMRKNKLENWPPEAKQKGEMSMNNTSKKTAYRYRQFYRDDPRRIFLRYPAVCKDCGKKMEKEEEAFYWPIGKKIYCQECGEPRYQEFLQLAQDEDFFSTSSAYKRTKVSSPQKEVEIDASEPLEQAIRKFLELEEQYRLAMDMAKEYKEELARLSEGEELDSLFSMADEGLRVIIKCQQLMVELSSVSRAVVPYKEVLDKVMDVYPNLVEPIKEIIKNLSKVSAPTRKMKIRQAFSLTKKLKALWKGLLTRLHKVEKDLDFELRRIRSSVQSRSGGRHAMKRRALEEADHRILVWWTLVPLLKDMVDAAAEYLAEKEDPRNYSYQEFEDAVWEIVSDTFDTFIADILRERVPENYRFYKSKKISSVRKRGQIVFTPQSITQEPETREPRGVFEPPPVEQKKEAPAKSYFPLEDIKRWFGGAIPKQDSVIEDGEGNLWRFKGSVGPDMFEIEMIEENGPSPEEENRQNGNVPPLTEEEDWQSGNAPFLTEEEGGAEREMSKEFAKERMRKLAMRTTCGECENFYPSVNKETGKCLAYRRAVSSWMDAEDCDDFAPLHRQQAERYTPVPAMREDLAAEGRRGGRAVKVGSEAVCENCENFLPIEGSKRGRCAAYHRIVSKNRDAFNCPEYQLLGESLSLLSSRRNCQQKRGKRNSYGRSHLGQLFFPTEKAILLFSQDPSLLKEKVEAMNQTEMAALMEEIKMIPSAMDVYDFLVAVWNRRFGGGEDIEGQTPFYSTDAPLAYQTMKPKRDQELTARFARDQFRSERDAVKTILRTFGEKATEISADRQFVYVTFEK